MELTTCDRDNSSFVFTLFLEDLRLSTNQFSGTISSSILQMRNLEILHLDHNQFDGTFPNMFDSAPRITELKLDRNKFSGPIPDKVWHLQGVSKYPGVRKHAFAYECLLTLFSVVCRNLGARQQQIQWHDRPEHWYLGGCCDYIVASEWIDGQHPYWNRIFERRCKPDLEQQQVGWDNSHRTRGVLSVVSAWSGPK